jgi:hypothetical protein
LHKQATQSQRTQGSPLQPPILGGSPGTSPQPITLRSARGYSLARSIPTGAAPGAANTLQRYQGRVHDQIKRIVRETLSQPLILPNGLKPGSIKLPSENAVEPYAGSSRYKHLEMFVTMVSVDLYLKGA